MDTFKIYRAIDDKIYVFPLSKLEMSLIYQKQRRLWDKDRVMQILETEVQDDPDNKVIRKMYDSVNNEDILDMVASDFRDELDYMEYDFELETIEKAYDKVMRRIKEVP